MRKVKLRMNEQEKYETIKYVVEHNGSKKRASIKLGISIRQVNRLIIIYKEKGKAGFVHGNRTRKPINAFDNSISEDIILLYNNKYQDFNFRHFKEYLEEEEKIKVSYDFIYKTLTKAGILSPKARKKTKREFKKKQLLEEKKINLAMSEETIEDIVNHFIDYFVALIELYRTGNAVDFYTSDMNNERSSIDKLSQSERHVLENLKELLKTYDNSGTLSSDVWKNLQEIVTSGVDISRERENKETALQNTTQEHMNNTLDANSQQEIIRESVVGMQKCLDTIKGLDIDDQKRIDRVEVTQRHLDKIDGITALNSGRKEMLKEMLDSYVDMRVESFKVMEDLSRKAVDSYQHRELIDLSVYSRYSVASNGLSGLSKSFVDDSAKIMNPTSSDMLQNRFRAEITLINMATNYLRDGTISPEVFSLDSGIMLPSGASDTHLALMSTPEAREMRMRKSQNPELSSMFDNSSVVQETANLKK